MPCSDSSSGLNFRVDFDGKLISFEFAKITCSSEIKGESGYARYCQGKLLSEILDQRFETIAVDLGIEDPEKQFVLYLEWEALRAGIAQYLGMEHESIDPERCRISSVEHTEDYIEVAEVILPPKELPKIIACGLADRIKSEKLEEGRGK